MSDIRRITLADGRVFAGAVVIDGHDAVDLVWTDRGVNHQVCIPKGEIAGSDDLRMPGILPDDEGRFLCRGCHGKFHITEMAFGRCEPCHEKSLG